MSGSIQSRNKYNTIRNYGILMNEAIVTINPRAALKVSMGRRKTGQNVATTNLITTLLALYMEKVIRSVNVS